MYSTQTQAINTFPKKYTNVTKEYKKSTKNCNNYEWGHAWEFLHV